ncbi:DUF924 domain-containing protein [Massilia atriviolacea]|uniref:DUF924 domain-containing protein n=1 Tax=Massilia atriviolacea TaxID=2495579 RepID=A0A430HNY1_9BURK|nr:DUF924 family protein [Massilia atriviolacea]RSZ59240.1 DUF924 domain-containing protein [Massilia atriviolacea]
MKAQDILDFWFLPEGTEGHDQPRQAWFRKSEAFDAEVVERFGHLLEHAVAGGLREWEEEGPQGALARIVLLDQLTRNAWRGQPASFSGDALALAAATRLVDSGADRTLTPVQRWFAYMPFEHAEDARMQERSVALFAGLAQYGEAFEGALDYAHRHRGVIARFGRFPHRNPILGRASTPEEAGYLEQPGSGF